MNERRFDGPPPDSELAVEIGPDRAFSDFKVVESAETIVFRPAGVPLVPAAIFIVAFAAALTLGPWAWEAAGNELPAHLEDGMVTALTVMLWLLIVPSMLAVLWGIDGMARRHGPGVIVDRATRRLSLPLAGLEVDADDVVAFVEVSGQRRYSGTISSIVVWSAVVRDGDQWVQAAIGKRTARIIGRSPLESVAEFYGLSVRPLRLRTQSSSSK